MTIPPMHGVNTDDCTFCALIANPGKDLVCIAAGPRFRVLPAADQRPANHGHMLLMPAIHVTDLGQLPTDHARDLLLALHAVTDAVREAFAATGTAVRLNLGPPGQSMAHLHIHIIPRHLDDGFPTTVSVPVALAQRQQQTRILHPHLVRRIDAI